MLFRQVPNGMAGSANDSRTTAAAESSFASCDVPRALV